MPHIAILSASVRSGRASHRVALYFKSYIEGRDLATAEIIDLHAYKFPVFEERLKYQQNPPPDVLEFAARIRKADGVIIVTPEYNGGYPASLKNVTDLLYEEWYHKPIAITTVSDGSFGGSQVITSLQFHLWKMKAWTVPAMFPVPNVARTFDEFGHPSEPVNTDKRATVFVNELLWCVQAKMKMEKE